MLFCRQYRESTVKASAGQSGISLIDHFDTSAYATKFAGS